MKETVMREDFQAYWDDFEYLIERLVPMIKEHYVECSNPQQNKVLNLQMPDQILKDLGKITENGASIEEINEAVKTTFKYSMKTMNPFFQDKLYSGSESIGQISELILGVLNTATSVYHVSPVFSTMELDLVRIFGKEVKYDMDQIDGVISPGGSISNFTAMLCARQKYFPHIKAKGFLIEDRPVCFTSAQSHYSVKRAAEMCGFGNENCVKIPTYPESGALIPEELEKAIQESISQNKKPFFVNCMAGTTVYGSYDDYTAVAAICKKYDVWMHVDGCWGGHLVWIDEMKETLFKGIESSDSFSINAHKGFGVPQQCALLVINKHKGLLLETNSSNATYLFHPSDTQKYDLSDKSICCGRRPDGYKCWMMLKRYGINGFKDIAKFGWDRSRLFRQYILEQPERYILVQEPTGTNVNFWYIPTYYRENKDKYTFDEKNKIHRIIFERMKKKGSLLIQLNPEKEHGLPNFFRTTFKAGRFTDDDLKWILDEVDRIGCDINPDTQCDI